MQIRVSSLPHAWLIDLDGTVLLHNGHKNGGDALLPGVAEFWQAVPRADTIILMSTRTESEKAATLEFILSHGLRFDQAVFGLPVGERLLLNDAKPGGLQTAIAVVVERDAGLTTLSISIDPDL